MAVSINCFTFQYSPSELHVKSGPEKNVQSLMHYHYATVRRRMARFASINQSINQSIQKVLTQRRGQHCTNNNSTYNTEQQTVTRIKSCYRS